MQLYQEEIEFWLQGHGSKLRLLKTKGVILFLVPGKLPFPHELANQPVW